MQNFLSLFLQLHLLIRADFRSCKKQWIGEKILAVSELLRQFFQSFDQYSKDISETLHYVLSFGYGFCNYFFAGRSSLKNTLWFLPELIDFWIWGVTCAIYCVAFSKDFWFLFAILVRRLISLHVKHSKTSLSRLPLYRKRFLSN